MFEQRSSRAKKAVEGSSIPRMMRKSDLVLFIFNPVKHIIDRLARLTYGSMKVLSTVTRKIHGL